MSYNVLLIAYTKFETEKNLENIRQKRIEKRLSLLAVANASDISHSHLFYIESKKVIPSIDVVVRLAKSMDIPLKDLFN